MKKKPIIQITIVLFLLALIIDGLIALGCFNLFVRLGNFFYEGYIINFTASTNYDISVFLLTIATTLFVFSFSAFAFIKNSYAKRFFISGRSIDFNINFLGTYRLSSLFIYLLPITYILSFINFLFGNFDWSSIYSINSAFASWLVIFLIIIIALQTSDCKVIEFFNNLKIKTIGIIIIKIKIHLVTKNIRNKLKSSIYIEDIKAKKEVENKEILEIVYDFNDFGYLIEADSQIKAFQKYLSEGYELIKNGKPICEEIEFINFYLKKRVKKFPYLFKIFFIESLYPYLLLIFLELFTSHQYVLFLTTIENYLNCLTIPLVNKHKDKLTDKINISVSNKLIKDSIELIKKFKLNDISSVLYNYNCTAIKKQIVKLENQIKD